MTRVRALKLGPMANIVYLLADAETGECGVVDPAWDTPAILAALREEGLALARVLLTHGHRDHVNGVAELVRSAPGTPVHVHPADAGALEGVRKSLRPTGDGETVTLGRTSVTFLHTSGHTGGSQCLLCDGRLFTGDTLFIGSCGRVDLPGSDPEAMYRSLQRLAALPAETLILPGHDYGDVPSATMGEERGRNPYLKACAEGPLERFLKLVS